MATKVSIAIRYAKAINSLVDLHNKLADLSGAEKFVPYMGGDENKRAIMLEQLSSNLEVMVNDLIENSDSITLEVKMEK